MQTVVLAAGRGTRMRPLTDRRPKPMLPVADRPLVAHTVEAAVKAGAERIVLVVGDSTDGAAEGVDDEEAASRAAGRESAIERFFDVSPVGVPIEYAVQDERLGTADAVRTAADHLDDAPFVVLNGDALFDTGGLADLYAGGPAVACLRVDDPSQYGVLDVESDDGTAVEMPDGTADDGPGEATDGRTVGERVTGVVEKPADPPSDLVNAGAYQFPAAALEWLEVPRSERGEHELTDVLARAIEYVDVRPVPLERWLDVGRPWELLAANEWKVTERTVAAPTHGGAGEIAAGVEPDRDGSRSIGDGEISPDATLLGPVVVEAGATVREGVTLEGPVLVRSGASVGPNAYVRGTTVIGPDANVGHAVEIKNSVLMREAKAGHLSYVGDSILGRGTNLGAGTVVANLRHDDEPVKLTVKGERVSTGRRKFGVVLGDDAKTGIDTSLNAGVTLSTGASTAPGETVLRDR